MDIQTILETDLYMDIIIAVIILTVFVFAAKAAFYIIDKYVMRAAKKTKTELDDRVVESLKKPAYAIVILIGLYFSLSYITVLSPHTVLIQRIFIVLAVLVAAFAVSGIVSIIIRGYMEKVAHKTETELDEQFLPILQKLANLFIYFIAFILILDQFGVEITPFIASLGIGGLAIALALQNILGDMFCSFSIYFDKPFRVGDFIIVGDYLGTVKNIGIQTTRIQALQGEEVVISNRQLVASWIQNFKKMDRRRIVFNFGVKYETPLKKLEKINGFVKDILSKIELAELDRVHFKKFGDFSLDFEVVYYVNISDYARYMDIQQEINLALIRQFEKEGIEFAYPTQKVFVSKE